MITKEQYNQYLSLFTAEEIDADPAISASLDLMYSAIPAWERDDYLDELYAHDPDEPYWMR